MAGSWKEYPCRHTCTVIAGLIFIIFPTSTRASAKRPRRIRAIANNRWASLNSVCVRASAASANSVQNQIRPAPAVVVEPTQCRIPRRDLISPFKRLIRSTSLQKYHHQRGEHERVIGCQSDRPVHRARVHRQNLALERAREPKANWQASPPAERDAHCQEPVERVPLLFEHRPGDHR